MPFLQPPTLVRLTGKTDSARYIIPFSYDFTGEISSAQNLGGIAFNGFVLTLNVSSLSNVLNLPPVRSMQFTQGFNMSASDFPETGPLIVYVPATGSLSRLAYGGVSPNVSLSSGTGIVSGVIPIVANEPSVIMFGKQVDENNSMSGKLSASLFTFDVPPYISQGLSLTES